MHNAIRGYWVSGLVKLDFYRYKIVLYIYVRKSFGLYFVSSEGGDKHPKNSIRNQICPCSIFSEAIMNYVWYQATLTVTAFQKWSSYLLIFRFLFGSHDI